MAPTRRKRGPFQPIELKLQKMKTNRKAEKMATGIKRINDFIGTLAGNGRPSAIAVRPLL